MLNGPKNIQKSVRLTSATFQAIDDYRGDGFNAKLGNLVADYLSGREQFEKDLRLLQEQVDDKYAELLAIQNRIKNVREVDTRFSMLVAAVTGLLGSD